MGSVNKLCFFGVMNVFAGLEGLGVRESTLSGTLVGVLDLWWTTTEKDCWVGGGDKVSLKLVGAVLFVYNFLRILGGDA